MDNDLRAQFMLDPDVTFLNHGGLGGCPVPVFEAFLRYQRELETRPSKFFTQAADRARAARERVGAYLNTDPDDIVFVTNATTGINTVARSLRLEPGDEILTTDHEYGSMNRTWEYIAERTGAKYIHHPIPLPVTTHEAFVESFWSSVTPRTRVIFMSHITSPTALTFPVQQICHRAREAGILTVIDGAHVPGHIPLDLRAVDADFYTGNFHKWTCTPKGSAFLYARADKQHLVEPLVVSAGWTPESTFVSRHLWNGTRNICAFLAAPDALDFLEAHNWDAERARCHELARGLRARMAALTGLPPVVPDSPEWFAQMVIAPLPPCDFAEIGPRLYNDYRIEVVLSGHDEYQLLRVSFQGYNTQADADRLIGALDELVFSKTQAAPAAGA
jgi:isopenicillin-N epimerase